jgi:protein regulator of cytokinesis 1
MSIDTLLESLQTQIHAKTSLLPTLYSQLGLPPSALTDELTLLQNKLSECVDQVVAARQGEVDSWLERCRSVDRQIEALLKATGGSKPAYPTDLPLPKQHESLCKLREKLKQLYKTKLEQYTSIRSRLVNFTRILGETFVCYRPQSYDSTQDDILIDLTPEALSKLEKDMVRCKNEASRRQTILVEAFDQLEWLRAELGVPLPSPDPFLADGEGPDQQSIFSAILDKYLNRRDSFVLTAVEPTQELLEWTADLTERMENLKMKREAHIQSIYDQLEALWKRLGIEDSEIDEFVDSWQGSNDAVIEAVSLVLVSQHVTDSFYQYENELERMLELKRSTMSTFIENARKEIEELWDELMMGETQRKAFLPFIDGENILYS